MSSRRASQAHEAFVQLALMMAKGAGRLYNPKALQRLQEGVAAKQPPRSPTRNDNGACATPPRALIAGSETCKRTLILNDAPVPAGSHCAMTYHVSKVFWLKRPGFDQREHGSLGSARQLDMRGLAGGSSDLRTGHWSVHTNRSGAHSAA